MSAKRHIFRPGSPSLGLLLISGFVALLLVLISTYTDLLKPTRAYLLDLVAPFYGVTDVGNTVSDWADNSLVSRDELIRRNSQLRDENLILQRDVMTMAALQGENATLRQLLGAAEFFRERVLIVELVGTPPDTETHRIILDRGSEDGIRERLPILDEAGLIGQVVTVSTENSEVLLLSDRTHALPVQILRNGARAVAEGVGDYDSLSLRNIPATYDVKVDDEVISSGLGGTFPHGYPVGKVTSVNSSGSSPFLDVRVQPHAGLDTSRQMLVLFSEVQKLKSSSPIEQPSGGEDVSRLSTGEQDD